MRFSARGLGFDTCSRVPESSDDIPEFEKKRTRTHPFRSEGGIALFQSNAAALRGSSFRKGIPELWLCYVGGSLMILVGKVEASL